MYKKATAVFAVLLILGAYVSLQPSLPEDRNSMHEEKQEENFGPAPDSSISPPPENSGGSGYKNLVNFLVQNHVDKKRYRRFTPREKAKLAENLGLIVIHAENMKEYNHALPNPAAFPENFPEEIVKKHERKMNAAVVFENRTTYKIGYYIGSSLDNAVRRRNYVCSDFARDLQEDALESGFRCAYAEVFVKGLSYGHAINAFAIDNGLVFVEPQTDKIIGPLSVGDQLDGYTVENITLHWSADTSS